MMFVLCWLTIHMELLKNLSFSQSLVCCLNKTSLACKVSNMNALRYSYSQTRSLDTDLLTLDLTHVISTHVLMVLTGIKPPGNNFCCLCTGGALVAQMIENYCLKQSLLENQYQYASVDQVLIFCKKMGTSHICVGETASDNGEYQPAG